MCFCYYLFLICACETLQLQSTVLFQISKMIILQIFILVLVSKKFADSTTTLSEESCSQGFCDVPFHSSESGELPLPPGYKRYEQPLGNGTESMPVLVGLIIRGVTNVNTKDQLVDLDVEISISWVDLEILSYFLNTEKGRKKREEYKDRITLDSEILRHIWKPDVVIEELQSVSSTSLLSRQSSLQFYAGNESLVIPGTIFYNARKSLRLYCNMDFSFYPADIQKCVYNLRSFSYGEDKLFLLWETDHISLDTPENANFDFQLSGVEPGNKYKDLYVTTGYAQERKNFSMLSFTLQIRRKIQYHLVQTYLPSILLVLITWLCFWLPTDMVEARIGISMTSLLTLTSMFTTVREEAPSVSYIKAIDIWMVFCIFLIFLALVLFTAIHWMLRKIRKFKVYRKKAEEMTEIEIGEQRLPALRELKLYLQVMNGCVKYAFVVFIFAYIFFLAGYATWVLSWSEYYTWDPPAMFNAGVEGGRKWYIPHKVEQDEDGHGYKNENRLFDYILQVSSLYSGQS